MSDKQLVKYNALVEQISLLVQSHQQNLVRTINTTITFTYWHIGRYIVEFEQKGEKRAEYGTALLKNLSKDLTEQLGKGFSYRNLRLFRQFYLTFPIVQSLTAQSENEEIPIWQSPIAKSSNEDKKEIWQTLSAKSSRPIEIA